MTLGNRYETNISTKPAQARPDPRLSCAHVHAQWSQGADGASCKGSRALGDLIDTPLGSSADARLPRHARLRRPGDFRNVFAKPEKSVDSCFTVLARRNGRQPARLGLAISKKCARRSVDRSRLKRVVRESFRRRRHRLHGIDLVVLCRRSAVTSQNSRLFSSLTVHWNRVQDQLCATC